MLVETTNYNRTYSSQYTYENSVMENLLKKSKGEQYEYISK